MRRPVVVALLMCLAMASPAAAERAAIVAVDLGPGMPEFMRAKALASVKDGLVAAGFDVTSTDQVAPKLAQQNLAQCRTGPCLSNVGKVVDAPWLVLVSITRKDESTIIVMKLVDARSTDARAEVHEVCDLCGQSEIDDRINVAASALRVKAEAERQRDGGAPAAPGGKIRVAVVPSIAVNVEAARVDSLGQDLADALAAELEVDAVGGLEVRRQLPAEGLPADCVTTPSCVSDVAKRTSANQLLFIVLVNTGSGGSIQVDSTWIDPATGRTATRRPIDIVSPESARGTFAASAKQLLPDAPVRVKPTTGGGFGGKMSEAVPRHFTTPAKIAGAVGLVGLGVGIGVGLSVRSRYNDCDAAPAACSQSERDSIRNRGFIADFGFLIATAGAVTTGILWATSGKESQLVVSPTESGAAVSFSGRF